MLLSVSSLHMLTMLVKVRWMINIFPSQLNFHLDLTFFMLFCRRHHFGLLLKPNGNLVMKLMSKTSFFSTQNFWSLSGCSIWRQSIATRCQRTSNIKQCLLRNLMNLCNNTRIDSEYTSQHRFDGNFPPSKMFSRHVALHLKALPSPSRWCGLINCLHLHNYTIKKISMHSSFCLYSAWIWTYLNNTTWVEIKRKKHTKKINTENLLNKKNTWRKYWFFLSWKIFTNCRSIDREFYFHLIALLDVFL